jgi:hypothetical protein
LRFPERNTVFIRYNWKETLIWFAASEPLLLMLADCIDLSAAASGLAWRGKRYVPMELEIAAGRGWCGAARGG